MQSMCSDRLAEQSLSLLQSRESLCQRGGQSAGGWQRSWRMVARSLLPPTMKWSSHPSIPPAPGLETACWRWEGREPGRTRSWALRDWRWPAELVTDRSSPGSRIRSSPRVGSSPSAASSVAPGAPAASSAACPASRSSATSVRHAGP